eukprot:CCRYP_019660-RC/>CCRYP_019660-RC protein AED:0.48 eAED:1.00 QI:0/0/0/1/0/0/2/0/92
MISSEHETCKSALLSKASPSDTVQDVGEDRSRLVFPPSPATASPMAANTSAVVLMARGINWEPGCGHTSMIGNEGDKHESLRAEGCVRVYQG